MIVDSIGIQVDFDMRYCVPFCIFLNFSLTFVLKLGDKCCKVHLELGFLNKYK